MGFESKIISFLHLLSSFDIVILVMKKGFKLNLIRFESTQTKDGNHGKRYELRRRI